MLKTNSIAKTIGENLSPNQKRLVAEVIGTFIVVVLATGSVVIDARLKGFWVLLL